MTGDEFLRELREALSHLYDLRRLRGSSLVGRFGLANRVDTPSALQKVLIEAIESLQPRPDEPAHSDAWLIHGALLYRYVEQMSQPEVANQLGLSVRHLRRREHDALEALAGLLWRKYSLGTALDISGTLEPEPPRPSLNEELAWLQESPGARSADPASVLPAVLGLARGLATRYDTALEATLSEDLPLMAADQVAVRQILLHLLTVAIARSSGGRVRFAAMAAPQAVEFRIACSGGEAAARPIPLDEATSLEMARRLASLSGGQLALSTGRATLSAVLTFAAAEPLLVLVIDDNADALNLLQRYAAGTRYRLHTTRDPRQVLELAERLRPRIIVLDVMMPEVDGWETLGRLRQSPLTAHIPVIVHTILTQEDLAAYLGASAYLRKPVTRQAFLAALDQQARPAATEPG